MNNMEQIIAASKLGELIQKKKAEENKKALTFFIIVPKWDDEEYCKQYVKESEKVFRFIAEIVAGGASA